MTLDEAIELLTHSVPRGISPHDPELKKALMLGIEALNRVKWHKEQHAPGYYELLPGETKE